MERKLGSLAFGVAALFLLCGIASAQWLNLPLAGTPRNADGQPNLTAPAPKTSDGKPDLSGIWRVADGRLLGNLAANEPGGAPFQPWAAVLYKERQDNLAKDRPSGRCLPHGVPDAMMVRSGPFKIAQTPGVVFILYEEFNHYRQVFTDGRGLPKVTNPAWFGYSVGKWEGDVFVVTRSGSMTSRGLTIPVILIPKRCALRRSSHGAISATLKSRSQSTTQRRTQDRGRSMHVSIWCRTAS